MAGAALFPALLVLSWPIFLSFPTDQISLFFSRWHTAVQKQLKQEMRASWWLFDSSWVASTDRTTHGSLSNYFQPYLRCLDPTGPRVKIDLFSSSEILNCWLFDSSCLRYLNCFFFMWNSCDTFRLDSKHRTQPETTRKQEVRVLFVWVAWTDRTAAHSSVWGGTNVWKSVSVLWVTWTSTLRNTISRRRAKTDVIISTTSETYDRFNVMPFWR